MRRAYAVLVGWMVLGGLADFVSTCMAASGGRGREGNALMVGVVSRPAAFVAVKVGSAVAFAVLGRASWRRYGWAYWPVVVLGAGALAAEGFAVAGNVALGR